MISGVDCPMCADAHLPENEHGSLIAELPGSDARLAVNQTRAGYCVVVAKRHAAELYDLTPSELGLFWADVAAVAQAVSSVFAPVKLDYLVMGHLCPHVHCHLLPQYADDDPHGLLNPQAGDVRLPPDEWSARLAAVRAALGAPQVLLVTGPGGAGKTTLAAGLAERLGWTHVAEDDAWIANGWGHGLRTVEHEEVVQAQVTDEVLAAVRSGRSVALDLILYKVPPNPVTAYRAFLDAAGVPHRTVVLRPGVHEILRRMRERGRPRDVYALDQRQVDATWQLGVIDRCGFPEGDVIDPTDVPVDELVSRVAEMVALR